MAIRAHSSAFFKSVSAIVLLVAACLSGGSARAQVMDIASLDLSGLPEGTPLATQLGIRDAFYLAERRWESRLIGFSAQLPGYVQQRLRPVQINAVITTIDGPGGILGQAGPTQLFSYDGSKPYAISQTGDMEFDGEDAVTFYNLGLFDDIVLHEMAHALGFGSLWTENRLNLGPLGHYTGAYALKRYRIEAKKPNALYVPVEQLGGGGTARSHWALFEPVDGFFDTFERRELMTGFIGDVTFISETTWASYADLGYKVKGVNDKLIGTRPGNGPRTTPTGITTGTN